MPTVALEFSDGSVLPATAEEKARIVLNDWRTLADLVFDPTARKLGEAYITGALDVVGDVEAAIAGAEASFTRQRSRVSGRLTRLLRLGRALYRPVRAGIQLRGKPGSHERAKQAISYHYDLPPEFWSAWLDRTLSYSCAYFETGDEDIHTAQRQKLDYVCRKLCLRQGDTLLDLGCGWGGLACHAAQHFKTRVTGVTLSRGQVSYASSMIRDLSLDDVCSIVQGDLRNYRGPQPVDKAVSVGAVEHFPTQALPAFFSAAWNNLKPGGLFLCHGITSRRVESGSDATSFTHRYLFPDYQLSPVHLLIAEAEKVGFEVRDVESLREHYVRTFETWRQRLEEGKDKLIALVGVETYRIFLLSLHYMRYRHRSGDNNLHQILLARAEDGEVSLPLTRRSWYVH